MSNDPNLDLQLREFLIATEADRRQGHTVQNLRLEIFNLGRTIYGMNARIASLESDRDEMREQLDLNTGAIVAIKRRVRHGPEDSEMDTGQYNLAAIQRRVEEQEKKRADSERVRAENSTWWKRSVVMWLVGGLGFVAATAITILLTMAITNSRPPPPSAPSPPVIVRP